MSVFSQPDHYVPQGSNLLESLTDEQRKKIRKRMEQWLTEKKVI